jgi:hypothetical protein
MGAAPSPHTSVWRRSVSGGALAPAAALWTAPAPGCVRAACASSHLTRRHPRPPEAPTPHLHLHRLRQVRTDGHAVACTQSIECTSRVAGSPKSLRGWPRSHCSQCNAPTQHWPWRLPHTWSNMRAVYATCLVAAGTQASCALGEVCCTKAWSSFSKCCAATACNNDEPSCLGACTACTHPPSCMPGHE